MGCCCAVITIVIILVIIKVLIKLTIGWNKSYTCLAEKTTIVTGSNTGIGFFTAQEFAKRGARVILACRDKDRAEKAKEKIIEATDNPNVVVKLVDFASLESVRKFAKEINAEEKRLDILVNNAGAAGVNDVTTIDGNNLLVQVNHLGPFLLTNLLIDLLKKSTPSRIVNVSSAASWWAKLKPNDLNAFPTAKPARSINYSNTKLCNIMFTNELARQLEGSGVVAYSVHPGVVNTEIFRRLHRFGKIILSMILPFFKTSEEGAQTSIHVALSKDIEGVSGEYFDNCRIAWFPPMHKLARNEGVVKKVWEKSEELVKLKPEERQL